MIGFAIPWLFGMALVAALTITALTEFASMPPGVA